MTDADFVLESVRRAGKELTLNQVHARISEVSRDTLLEMLLWLVEQGKLKITCSGGYLGFPPRTFASV